MLKAGVIGLGDMGSGLAKNLLKNGFKTSGFDLDPVRMTAFEALGGQPQGSPSEVGEAADAVFVMVMNGAQVKSVLFDDQGLTQGLTEGKAIILTATIHPREASEIADSLADSGFAFIDSPVSGGFAGAQEGTLTMMAAAPDRVLDAAEPVMKAVSANIHRVGETPGKGQQVKSCLQSLIGAQFAATFEAAALAAKAGISGEVLHQVFSTSSAGCGIVNNALEKIIDRAFEGTGSHIDTMHKDLTISLKMAEELGVPVHMASAAMQLFQAGRTKYPEGDNWVVTRVIEDIVGAELHR